MKKFIFGALLTLGVVAFVGCADKAAEQSAEKPATAKCGGEKSKCGGEAKKCGSENNGKCGSEKSESKCGGEKKEAKKCGAENNGKCGSEK